MLDLTKQALEILTRSILIPAVARTGEVDEYVRDMKRAIVEFVVEHYQTPKEVLARHFGKSDRWVYRQLEDAIKARQDTPAKGPAHDGQRLLIDVITFFQERYPAAATPGECSRALKANAWELNGVELAPCLALYVAMGYLEEVREHGSDGVKYRVPGRHLSHTARDANERLAFLQKHSEALLPIAISYLRGDEGARFSFSKAQVLPQYFVEAMRDVRQYQIKRIMKAVEDSMRDDPEELQPRVTFASLLLSGTLRSDEDSPPPIAISDSHAPQGQ